MEKENRQANADSTGVCEKIYNAVAFRAIHRKSSRSLLSPMAVTTDPNQPGAQRTGDNAAKTNALEKPVAQHEARPGEVHIPIEFGPTAVPEEKAKTARPPPSVQNSGGATISPAKIGHLNFKTEEDTSIPVSHGRSGKVASKKEARPAVSPLMEEKLEQQKTASASIVAIQGLGQGIIAPPPCPPGRKSSQEEQKKPKARAAAGDQEGRQPEHSSTAGNLFSDYITRAKNKMRTPSNVSEETVNTSRFTRLATRRDSFNDKVVNYINRARKGIRTTSNVGK